MRLKEETIARRLKEVQRLKEDYLKLATMPYTKR